MQDRSSQRNSNRVHLELASEVPFPELQGTRPGMYIKSKIRAEKPDPAVTKIQKRTLQDVQLYFVMKQRH